MADLDSEIALGLHLKAGASDLYLMNADYIHDETLDQDLQTTIDSLNSNIEYYSNLTSSDGALIFTEEDSEVSISLNVDNETIIINDDDKIQVQISEDSIGKLYSTDDGIALDYPDYYISGVGTDTLLADEAMLILFLLTLLLQTTEWEAGTAKLLLMLDTEGYGEIGADAAEYLGLGDGSEAVGFSSGDILIIYKLDDDLIETYNEYFDDDQTYFLGLIIHTQDAKAATDDFVGAMGYESVYDKTQINKIEDIESDVETALTQIDETCFRCYTGEYNANNCLWYGYYMYITLGRPESSDGEYWLLRVANAGTDDDGNMIIHQTVWSCLDATRCYMRNITTSDRNVYESPTTEYGDWEEVGADYITEDEINELFEDQEEYYADVASTVLDNLQSQIDELTSSVEELQANESTVSDSIKSVITVPFKAFISSADEITEENTAIGFEKYIYFDTTNNVFCIYNGDSLLTEWEESEDTDYWYLDSTYYYDDDGNVFKNKLYLCQDEDQIYTWDDDEGTLVKLTNAEIEATKAIITVPFYSVIDEDEDSFIFEEDNFGKYVYWNGNGNFVVYDMNLDTLTPEEKYEWDVINDGEVDVYPGSDFYYNSETAELYIHKVYYCIKDNNLYGYDSESGDLVPISDSISDEDIEALFE